MEVEPAGRPSVRVAPLRAAAPAFVPVADSLNDEWADGVVPLGLAALLPAARGRPRTLVARRSSSRSPRRDDEQQLPVSLDSSLVADDFATIKSLVKRPDLDLQQVRLIEFDAVAGRWACALRSGERVRITPDKLLS
eukprot:9713382-Heterocapsa_arctica.AAC.1